MNSFSLYKNPLMDPANKPEVAELDPYWAIRTPGDEGTTPNVTWSSLANQKPEAQAADTRTYSQRLADAASSTPEETSKGWLAKGLARGGDFAGSLADWAEKERAREDAQNTAAFNMARIMNEAVPSMWNLADTMRMRTGGLGAMAGGR